MDQRARASVGFFTATLLLLSLTAEDALLAELAALLEEWRSPWDA